MRGNKVRHYCTAMPSVATTVCAGHGTIPSAIPGNNLCHLRQPPVYGLRGTSCHPWHFHAIRGNFQLSHPLRLLPSVALLCHPWQQATHTIRGNQHPLPSMASQSCQLGNKHSTPTRQQAVRASCGNKHCQAICRNSHPTPSAAPAFGNNHPVPSEAPICAVRSTDLPPVAAV